LVNDRAGDTHLQHGHRKIGFFRVWMGVQNFILIVQNFTKKSTKYCQGLVILFKSGHAGETNLYTLNYKCTKFKANALNLYCIIICIY
jgi:hypothetical protein